MSVATAMTESLVIDQINIQIQEEIRAIVSVFIWSTEEDREESFRRGLTRIAEGRRRAIEIATEQA